MGTVDGVTSETNGPSSPDPSGSSDEPDIAQGGSAPPTTPMPVQTETEGRASGHAGTAPPACSAAAPGPPAGIAVGAAVGGAAGGDAERRRAGDTGSAAA